KVVPMGGGGQSFFGASVSLSADAALVGAPQEDAAYVGMLGQANGDPCDLPTECASRICTAGICGNPNGTACTGDVECRSGFCADGVCCNSACGNGSPDDCEACSVARGAAEDGICAVLSASTVCRSPVGLCDAPEVCDGVTTICPEDVIFTAGTECRPAPGVCDIPERCDGVSSDCPVDEFVPDNTLCGTPEGICPGVVSPDGTGCGECYAGTCEPYYDHSGDGFFGDGFDCRCRMPSSTSTNDAFAPLGLLGLSLALALRRRSR
ncbi:MAG TPA: hypothetical protein PKA58_32970, partial [Polyangium sp.]|nr:hypothetical protein [Polyangium sp.]